MIKEAIATAATRDEAIQKAKAALNAPIDADVKFEIIQDAQKKVLGLFGGKDAKVRAYYEAPDEVKAEKTPFINTILNAQTAKTPWKTFQRLYVFNIIGLDKTLQQAFIIPAKHIVNVSNVIKSPPCNCSPYTNHNY